MLCQCLQIKQGLLPPCYFHQSVTITKSQPFSPTSVLKPVNHLNAELNPICHLLALLRAHHILHVSRVRVKVHFNPSNAELNPIFHLLALLGAHHIFHFSRIRVKVHFNPSNAELNPICHLLALSGAHIILHVSRVRVNNQATVFFYPIFLHSRRCFFFLFSKVPRLRPSVS